TRNPDLRHDLAAVERVLVRNRGHTGGGIDKAHLTQRNGAIGVKGVNTIVFRSGEHDVVHAFFGNRDSGQVERLRVDIAIHSIGKQLSKLPGIDIRGIEYGFGEVLSGARQIVVVGEDVNLRLCQQAKRQKHATNGYSGHGNPLTSYSLKKIFRL